MKHIYGAVVKHYCTTNYKEYLAETAEAFFSTSRFRNDFFPFNNSELKSYDPDGYAMILKVFKISPDWVELY